MRKITVFLFLLGFLNALHLKSQNCDFKVTGVIVNKNNTPQSNQIINIKYSAFKDDPVITLTQYSNNDGSFTFCIDGIKSMSKLQIEIPSGYYKKQTKTYSNEQNNINIGSISLSEIEPLETPNPTEEISEKRLYSFGQNSVGKSLHLISAGFNSTVHPISDGSCHFNPTDFHNLGSSRTLFLINGVRKNFSSYIHVNDVPNKGESGVDIESIPFFALEKVKIEKQDASTLFGSDAIGGIIDFQLKKYTPELTMRISSGANFKNTDGINYALDINKAFSVGNKGFVSFTYSYLNQEETNRANRPGYDSLYTDSRNPEWQNWLKSNPSLGMRIGEPNILKNTVFYNSELFFSKDSDDKFYSFGGLTSRFTKSYANYRAPYWVKDNFRIFSTSDSTYNGFLPTFESTIVDNFFVFGFKGQITPSKSNSQFEYDINQTVSENDVDFFVNNSFNPSLGKDSPTSFYSAGFNLAMKSTKASLTWTKNEQFNIKFGSEYRSEKYLIKTGEENSYFGEGTVSFPGTPIKNSLVASRNNFAGYADLNYNANPLIINLSGRYEKYNNFPENFAGKASALYELNNPKDKKSFKFIIRGSISSGYRAPSLQQIYFGRIQTVALGPDVTNRGVFNTKSSVVRRLGIPELRSELSNNLSFGSAINWDIDDLKRFSASIDFYNINIKDRIVLSSTIDGTLITDTTLILKKLLNENKISSLNFFINTLNTQSSGLDINIKYRNTLQNEKNFFEVRFDGNFIIKNDITTPAFTPNSISEANVDIFDRRAQSILLYSRPNNKLITSFEFGNSESWSFMVSSNYFGKVKWQHPTDPVKDQEFKRTVLININSEVSLSKYISFSLAINNLFNSYPEELDPKGDARTNLGGRFKYYREVNQSGYNGTSFLLSLNVRINK